MTHQIVSPAGTWVRVDRDYTVIDCGEDAPAILRQNVGRVMWDVFPGSEVAFRRHYDRAFDDGIASAVVEYASNIVNIHAVREPNDVLLIAQEAVTLEGMSECLRKLNEMGRTKQAIMECRACGYGGGCAVVPADDADWPTCDFCEARLCFIELVCVNYDDVKECVDLVVERYGDAGLVELVWAAMAAMNVPS